MKDMIMSFEDVDKIAQHTTSVVDLWNYCKAIMDDEFIERREENLDGTITTCLEDEFISFNLATIDEFNNFKLAGEKKISLVDGLNIILDYMGFYDQINTFQLEDAYYDLKNLIEASNYMIYDDSIFCDFNKIVTVNV